MTPSFTPRRPGCPPRLHLEQASGGDWPPGVEAHVAACADCARELSALVEQQRAFLAARPTGRFVAQLERRRGTRRGLVLGGLVAVAAALTLTFALPPSPHLTFKGALTRVTVQRGAQQFSADERTALREGDALRFTVQAPAPGFVVVLERDGQGHVTVVAPFGARAALAVQAGQTVLPDSAVLDATKGPERFVTVFAERSFDVAALAAQLEQGEPVRCDGCRVEEAKFDKP
ncbi:MAG: DUF4384 domain-containing protein [Myxococcota bacterium]